MMTKAVTLGADVVILDLEDAVVASQKGEARRHVAEALNTVDFGRSARAVRINAPGTPWAHDDVIELVEAAGTQIDLIIIPKVAAPRDVWFVDTLLSELEAKLGLTNRIGLELLIEEAQGLSRVEEIAACCERTEALVLGFGDLAASLGMRLDEFAGDDPDDPVEDAYAYPGDIWHAARSRLVAAARANGLDPVEGPYLDFANTDGLRREARRAAAMGYVGKWAIHPNQIDIAKTVFAPTAREIARARAAIDAMNESQEAGVGAAGVGGMMLDAATSRMFQQVLDRAASAEGGFPAISSRPLNTTPAD